MANVPRAKSYLVYDGYIMNIGLHAVMAVDDSISWLQYKNRNQTVVRVDWNSFCRGSFVLPGENGPGHFDYATDEGRKPPKSLIQVVLKIFSEGCCLVALNPDNIRVYPSGEVKLKNVTILGVQDLGSIQALRNMQMTNLVNVSQIIQNFFTVQGTTVPSDIRQLLTLISHHSLVDRCIYAIHPSLAPLVSFSAIFKEYKDYLDSKVSDAEYHIICAAIIEDFHGVDWRTIVSGSSLLMETYNFKKLSRTYRVPHNAQGQVQITASQLAALAQVNLVSSDPTGLTAFEVDVIDGHTLLTFLRKPPCSPHGGFGRWT